MKIRNALVAGSLLVTLHTFGQIADGGFESTGSWKQEPRFYIGRNGATHGGRGLAYFGLVEGTQIADVNATGAVSQLVRLGATPVALSFWAAITTAETDADVHDTVSIEILDSKGALLETKAVLSNRDAGGGTYVRYAHSLAAHVNKTVRVQFRGRSDKTRGTVFRIDDVGLDPLTSFSGSVRDAVSGAAVAGATIAWAGRETVSAADGSYRLTAVPCTTAKLVAGADRYETLSQSYTPPCSAKEGTKTIALTPAQTTLTGRLVDQSTDGPVAGAEVSFGTVTTRTASDGSFGLVFRGCAPATLRVSVAGFAAWQQTFNPVCSTGNVRDILIAPLLTNITVLVDDGASGIVRGAKVTWGAYTPRSESRGQFGFQSVVCESADLTVTAPACETARIRYTPTCDTSNLTVVSLVPRTTILSGTVTDTWSRAPVGGATVSFGSRSVTTGGDGRYTLAGVACQADLLRVVATRHQPALQTYTPSCTATTTKNISLTSIPTGRTLCGLVTDYRTGEGLIGATVRFGSTTATTDANSSFCMSGLACLGDNLTVRKDGYIDNTARYVPGNCTGTNMKDVSLLAREVNGSAYDAVARNGTMGMVLPDATVTWGAHTTTTDANGYFTFPHICQVAPLRISKPGYTTFERMTGYPCATGAFGDSAIARMAPSGTNFFVASAPPGATVTWGSYTGTPTAQGLYLFNDVPCQTATLAITAPNYETGRQLWRPPVCGTSTVVHAPLRQFGTNLSGIVIDGHTNARVAGAIVRYGAVTTTTDRSGRYFLPMLPCPMTAPLTASHPGYRDAQSTFTLNCQHFDKDLVLLR